MARESKYTKERLEEAVRASVSYAGVLRFLGLRQTGGSQGYIKRLVLEKGIGTDHFTQQSHMKGKPARNKLSPKDILVDKSGEKEAWGRTEVRLLRRALLELGLPYECVLCGVSEWQGQELTLQVDHIDGEYLNNSEENLRFLCPNCHSQTSTFGAKNIKVP